MATVHQRHERTDGQTDDLLYSKTHNAHRAVKTQKTRLGNWMRKSKCEKMSDGGEGVPPDKIS